MNQSPSKYFLPYQLRYLEDTSIFKIVEKSRRIGFTYVQSYEDTREAAMGKWDVWFSSADESAAKEYIQYVEQWAKVLNLAATSLGEVVINKAKDIKALSVEFASGKRINALSSNPKAFRSKGGKVVLDEFAFHEQGRALWKAATPARLWGFPIRVLSTHNGKSGMYYNLVDAARLGKNKASLHTITLMDAIDDGLVSKILKRNATEAEVKGFIDECRSIAGDEDSFLEEFMCVPVDENSAFMPYDLIAKVEVDPETLLWPAGQFGDVAGDLFLGMDIGRRKDLSVIWVIEKIGPVLLTRARVLMEKTRFRTQRETLYYYLRHPRLRRACIDETGIGMQLAEEAQEDFGKHKVEPITFTNIIKREMAFGLKKEVEETRFFIPSSPATREDWHSVKRTVTVAGNERFEGGNEAGHADEFWAAALANHAADGWGGPVTESVGSRSRRESARMAAGYSTY